MSPAAPPSVEALLLGVAGALTVCLGTVLALRSRSAMGSFAMVGMAAMGYALLGLAAAAHTGASDGLRAAVVQLVAALLAVAVGALCPAEETSRGDAPGTGLSRVAWGVGWLSLIGLPPFVGFHGKILIYRTVAAAGWEWLLVLALAATAGAVAAGLRWVTGQSVGPVAGPRAAILVVLIALVVAMGVYPEGALHVARLVAEAAS